MQIKKGDSVVFRDCSKNRNLRHDHPEWYPEPGTAGIVTDIDESDYGYEIEVHWPPATTSWDGIWWVHSDSLDLTEPGSDPDVNRRDPPEPEAAYDGT